MSEFPRLKTGAITQYPADRSTGYRTDVVSFVDGSEQRFGAYCKSLKAWTIRLSLLDEQEVNVLTEFFRNRNGAAGSFSFTDPWDGQVYPNCSFCNDEIRVDLKGYTEHNVTVLIRENLN